MAPAAGAGARGDKAQGAGAPQEPSPPALLAHYKNRIEEFEHERAEMLERVERLTLHAAEQHTLEWENRKRTEEVKELQKALSDAHVFLFEERQRLLTLQAENDELRLQEIEDRKRIRQLLGSSAGPDTTPQQQQQLRHYSVDALLLKIESLQAQLNEQKQLAAERIAALVEDRRIREAEEQAHRLHVSKQLEDSAAALARAEEQLRQTTKDYILAKQGTKSAQDRAVEAEAALHQERARLAEEVAQAKRRHEREVKELRQGAEAKLEDVTQHLRQQVRAKEDEVTGLTSVHSALKVQYDKRLAELEDKVARLTATNKQLEARRHLDMDGFTADVTYLRKMLTAVDRKLHEMRLVERLEDDERLDAILATLRRKAPAPANRPPQQPAPQRQQGMAPGGGAGPSDTSAVQDTSSVKGELAQGLSELRGRIKGLEDRLHAKKRHVHQQPGAGR